MRCWAGVLLVILVCFCCGCAKYYYQEDKSFDQCRIDRAECVVELNKRLAVQSKRPGGYEYEFVEDCMKSRGYELVTEGKLPLGAKRQDPAHTLHGFLYGQRRGIAGSVDEE
ncbi:MAG: hypothetical protein ACYS8I_01185 [Planctomycetota bacterium]